MKKITEEGAAINQHQSSIIKNQRFLKALVFGVIGFILLLGFYFVILTLVSGWAFTKEQFDDNWYYIIGLSAGFGIQIGLYSYLVQLHQKNSSGKIVAASGTTSTVSMIACCSHYLVNILPVIGAVGLVSFVSQYQTQFFWVGILANVAGIVYMIRKVSRRKSKPA